MSWVKTIIASDAAPPPLGHGMSYRRDIQGLRAVAILMVLAYHAGLPGFRGGFAGVDVFFAISGYLITAILLREIESTGRIDFARFYARRMRRLLPASLCMTICTLAVGLAILSPLELTRLAASAVSASGYVSNLWFLKQSTDYFNNAVGTNPLLHTWSLSVEEQFYVVWPGLILLVFRAWKTPRARAIAFMCVGVSSFAANLWLTHSFQSAAFFFAPARAWEFVIGGMASLLQGHVSLGRKPQQAIAWVGTALLLFSAFSLRPDNGFPGAWALLPVSGTTALLLYGGGNVRTHIAMRALESRPFQWIGNLSYSLYLWHWPVMVFAAILLRGRSNEWIALGLLAISGVLAAISYEFLEKRIRTSSSANEAHSTWLRGGLAITAAGVTIGLAFAWVANHRTWQAPNAVYARAGTPDSGDDKQCLTGFRSDLLKPCIFGPSKGRTLLLWGDSHAAQWFPALKAAAGAANWRVVMLAKASCPSAIVTVYNPRLQRNEDECLRWRQSSIAYIGAIKPDLVLITNSAAYVARPGFTNEYARLSPAAWEDGMRQVIRDISSKTGEVVVLRDTPRPEIDVPVCLARAVSHPGVFSSNECDVAAQKALAEPIWQLEVSAVNGVANATVLDMTAQFCSQAFCPATEHGFVVYRDGNHMSLDYSRFLGNSIRTALETIAARGHASL